MQQFRATKRRIPSRFWRAPSRHATNTSAFVKLRVLAEDKRVLVALAEAQDNLLKVLHDGDSGAIHQLERGHVVRLGELVRLAEPREVPAVDPDDDPAVRQTAVVPLELLHVLELALRHRRQAQVSARDDDTARPADDPRENAPHPDVDVLSVRDATSPRVGATDVTEIETQPTSST